MAGTDTVTVFTLGPQPEIHPAPDSLHHAFGKRWYRENEVIALGGKRYAKFGWPVGAHLARSDQPGERAVHVGEYDGVPVYGVLPLKPYARIVLVRLNAECQFQPYAEASEVQ